MKNSLFYLAKYQVTEDKAFHFRGKPIFQRGPSLIQHYIHDSDKISKKKDIFDKRHFSKSSQ